MHTCIQRISYMAQNNTRKLFSTKVIVRCASPYSAAVNVTLSTHERGEYRCTLDPEFTPRAVIVVPHHIRDTDIRSVKTQLADWSDDGRFTRQNWDSVISGVSEHPTHIEVEIKL